MSRPRPRPSPQNVATPVPPVAAAAPPLDVAPLDVAPPPIAPPPMVPPAAVPPAVPAAAKAVATEAEYTEQLVVPSQLALSALIAIAVGVILLALGLWPLAIIAVLIVGAVVYYLGVQILEVTPTRVAVGQGRGDNSPHLIQVADVVAGEIVTLSWPQCFGLGLPDTVDTTRFTVRAGPTVSLTMRDGEELRLSASNPQAVLDMIRR